MGPAVFLFFKGTEFWPFTSFPMYSQPYSHFYWPKVLVKSEDTASWELITKSDCYGTIGYVRFHFSIMNFIKNENSQAIRKLANALKDELRKNCPQDGDKQLKINLFEYQTRRSPFEKQIKTIFVEAPLEK